MKIKNLVGKITLNDSESSIPNKRKGQLALKNSELGSSNVWGVKDLL
jgi:hypothetical protein